MKSQDTSPSPTKKFEWYPNHGDEDGNNGFTICYGSPDDPFDHEIVGAEDTEEDATEACKRLNGILQSELGQLRAEKERLREENDVRGKAILYVLNRIEDSEAWWMSSPEKGGFDTEYLRAALGVDNKEL